MPTTTTIMNSDLASGAEQTDVLRTRLGSNKQTSTSSGSVEKTPPATSSAHSSYETPSHIVYGKLSLVAGIGRFDLKQRFEGYIVEVDNGEFTAIIKDKSDLDLPDEQVVIGIEEIPPGDRSLIKKGAVFYWSIGYSNYPGVPYTRESRITVRRLAGWSEYELDRARKNAAKLAQRFAND